MKETRVLKVDSAKPASDVIRFAANLIKRGDLVAFPTETVYGLGADALNPEAVKKLFHAKRRPLDNPPIVHVAEQVDVSRLAKNVSDIAEKLMRQFWPGALTLIFERLEIVPNITVAGLNTIAIRMPKNNVALALIRERDCPIAAPSANLAGKPSPTSAEHVLTDLNGRIDAVLDGGPTIVGVESTVVDLTVSPPQVLRPGGVSFEALVGTVQDVRLGEFASAEKVFEKGQVRSPGMKYRHYAPNAEIILVEGSLGAVESKITELAVLQKIEGKRVGVLATDETLGSYDGFVVKSVGSRKNLAEIASNLFRLLREFDRDGVDVILAEGVPTDGLGLAVMNRLRKASANRVVKAD
jgi:L-threonylcarbamoyladenylate synthase